MEHKQLTELLEQMTLEEKIAQMLQLVVTFLKGQKRMVRLQDR